MKSLSLAAIFLLSAVAGAQVKVSETRIKTDPANATIRPFETAVLQVLVYSALPDLVPQVKGMAVGVRVPVLAVERKVDSAGFAHGDIDRFQPPTDVLEEHRFQKCEIQILGETVVAEVAAFECRSTLEGHLCCKSLNHGRPASPAPCPPSWAEPPAPEVRESRTLGPSWPAASVSFSGIRRVSSCWRFNWTIV